MNMRPAPLSAAVAVAIATMVAACGGSATTPGASQPPTSGPSVAPATATPASQEPTSAPSVAPATATPAAVDGTPVAIAGFAFAPATLTIKVGDTVTWTNADGAPHTASAKDGSFDSGTLLRGASFSHTFATAGTFDYVCKFHASMTGTVIVE